MELEDHVSDTALQVRTALYEFRATVIKRWRSKLDHGHSTEDSPSPYRSMTFQYLLAFYNG